MKNFPKNFFFRWEKKFEKVENPKISKISDFQLFSKNFFSSKKNIFRDFFIFYVFIISHALPTPVVSRKSPCAVHKRGKRIPENRENPENHQKRYWYQTDGLGQVRHWTDAFLDDFLNFPDFRGCVCRACGRHRETCAIPLAWVGHEIW